MTANLLIDANITAGRELLERCGNSRSYQSAELDKEDLSDVQGLICRTSTRVGPALLDRAPSLKFVATASAGHDHLDLAALQQREIAWCSSPGCNASSVADYAVTAIVGLLDRMRMSRTPRVGVVGLGHVGSKVAARCHALGFEVHASDPPRAAREAGAPRGEAHDPPTPPLHPLTTLLRGCDLLTVHVPLTRVGPHATDGLVKVRDVSASSVRAVINTSRGGIVEAAGLSALPTPPWQAIDVWEAEPSPSPALLGAAEVLMATPHIAGYGAAAKWAASALLVAPITSILNSPPVAVPSFHAPDTPPLKVHWDATTGFPPLSDLLRTLLDVEPLDRALRASANAPAGERAAAFHALRNSQPYRLEFAHKGVDIYTPAVRREVAAALVAQLEACGVGRVTLHAQERTSA